MRIPRPRVSRSAAAIVIGIIAMLVGGKIGLSIINGPAKGIVLPVSVASHQTGGFNLTPTLLTDHFASFHYPAGLTIAPSTAFHAPVVAVHNFSYRDIETWNLAISILSIPSGRLTDNNAYQFRATNPSVYHADRESINNQQVVIMTDTSVGGFSKVAFLVHNPYQAVVSLYGDDTGGESELAAVFSMVLSSWHWLP